MNQQSNSPIDLEHLNQISEGDVEFELEVLHLYIEDISERIDKVREAIANSDRSELMRQAHHIKGSSGNVGALKMQSLAVQVEKLDQNHSQAQALQIIDDMIDSMKAVELFVNEKFLI
jgi:HPt (histidine-containing phosphotransfer) domain-containing protein